MMTLLIICSMFIICFSSMPANAQESENEIFNIISDNDLLVTGSLEGWPGTGTIYNPVIISNYDFNLSSDYIRSKDAWLAIENTSRYVRIQNCNFIVPENGTLRDYKGIAVGEYSRHSNNVEIRDCNFIGMQWGIEITNGDNICINNCTFEDNEWGIVSYRAENLTILNNIMNNCSRNGIIVRYCNNFEISWNDVRGSEHAIYSGFSDNGVISYNHLEFNDNGLTASYNNKIHNNIIENNKWNGTVILGSDNEIYANTIQDNGLYGLKINTGGNTIYDNNINGNEINTWDGGINDWLWKNDPLTISLIIFTIAIISILIYIYFARKKPDDEEGCFSVPYVLIALAMVALLMIIPMYPVHVTGHSSGGLGYYEEFDHYSVKTLTDVLINRYSWSESNFAMGGGWIKYYEADSAFILVYLAIFVCSMLLLSRINKAKNITGYFCQNQRWVSILMLSGAIASIMLVYYSWFHKFSWFIEPTYPAQYILIWGAVIAVSIIQIVWVVYLRHKKKEKVRIIQYQSQLDNDPSP